MNIVLRQAQIIDPASSFHLQQADILIQNGIIKSIGQVADQQVDKEINIKGLCLSPGWLDIFSHFCDPGFEHRETLESGAAAAAAGGFTDVLALPNTAPFLHNKSAIEYIVQKSRTLPVSIHPIAAITKNGEGKELAEMYDMHQSGAVAFSDGLCTIQSAGLLLKALQYLKAIDATVIQLPDDRSINPNGLMHEGIMSTRLGLPGKPAIAEELMIARDIELAKYTGSKIHFTGVSTAKGLALVQQAKTAGISVTCSVTPYHLFFSDEDLAGYDTNLKVNPPLRSKADRQALQKAVADGSVDCIASHHLPQNIDDKLVEFEYAKNGMVSLQTSFATVLTAIPNISAERIVELFCTRPRAIFGMQQPIIKEGEPATITLFQMEENWALTEAGIHSKSKNTPFAGKQLTGRPIGIINKDRVFLNEEN